MGSSNWWSIESKKMRIGACMKKIGISFLLLLMVIVSIKAVSFKEVLRNYQTGQGGAQFWFNESKQAVRLSGVTALMMYMMPWTGGFSTYPPFIIAEVIALGVGGATGLLYNYSPEMKHNMFKALNEAIPSSEREMMAAYHEHYDIQSSEPSVIPTVISQKRSNIIPLIMMGAMVGAGYKVYQWYTTKREKQVE